MEDTQYNVSFKKAEWIALLSLFLHLLFSGLAFLLYHWNHLESVFMLGWFFLAGSPVWFISLLHLRQKRRSQEEVLVEKKSSPETDDNSLFKENSLDPFSALTRLTYFEKWIIPGFTFTLGVFLLFLAGKLIFQYREVEIAQEIKNAPISAAFLVGFSFFSLLVSKFALGMSEQKNWRFLRAGGSYLFINAGISFFCALGAILARLKWFEFDYYFALLIPLLLGILGLELLLNLLLDVYRPRVLNQEIRFPYDSRFLELCTGSRGILSTAAQTLDYQFGFQVSETWFYQFFEKSIVPLLIFQLSTLYLLSCIVVVKPQEQVIIERFGHPLEEKVLFPGLHFKWPWPIEVIYRYPANQIQELHLGIQDQEEEVSHVFFPMMDETNSEKKKKSIIFTHEHNHLENHFLIANHSQQAKKDYLFNLEEEDLQVLKKEQVPLAFVQALRRNGESISPDPMIEIIQEDQEWLVRDSQSYYIINRQNGENKVYKLQEQTVPVNLLTVHIVVRYLIDNMINYAYKHGNPEGLIEGVSYREATQYLASVDMVTLLTTGRLKATHILLERIQKECNTNELGVKIVQVAILEVHPPIPVAKSFEGVIEALEEKQTKIAQAETYRKKTVHLTKAEQKKLIQEATTYLYEKQHLTLAESLMFKDILKAYEAGGRNFLARKYLDTLEKHIKKQRLYVLNVPNTSKQTDIINLEDQASSLTDLDLSEENNHE